MLNFRIKRTALFTLLFAAIGWTSSALAETGAQRLAPRPAPSSLALSSDGLPASSMRISAVAPKTLLNKKPADAFLRSIILPGWGQRYSGRYTRGAVFTAADAGIWLGLAWSYQAWKYGEDQFIAYAQEHAFLQGSHDHNFYVDIGNYSNRDDFNEARRQNRDYANQYTGANDWWEWDNDANRLTFKNQRIQSDKSKNRISYLVGALVLNRIVSAIDASRGLAKLQKDLSASGSISLEYNADVNGPALVWRGNLAGK